MKMRFVVTDSLPMLVMLYHKMMEVAYHGPVDAAEQMFVQMIELGPGPVLSYRSRTGERFAWVAWSDMNGYEIFYATGHQPGPENRFPPAKMPTGQREYCSSLNDILVHVYQYVVEGKLPKELVS
jgi:hypothetical protein